MGSATRWAEGGWNEGGREWMVVDTECIVPSWSLDGLSAERFENVSLRENALNNGLRMG